MMGLEEIETARDCRARPAPVMGLGCTRGLDVFPHEISVVMSSVGCPAE